MKRNIDKITLVRKSGKGYQLLIPIQFWFSNNSGLSLPLISMQYTNIRLVYRSATNLNMELKLLTEFIILDNDERRLFGSLKYEYIIQTYKILPSVTINKPNQVIDKNLTGLIKDIYLVTTPYIQTITNYDIRFNSYIIAYNLWLSRKTIINFDTNIINFDTNIINFDTHIINFDTHIINSNELEYSIWFTSIVKSSTSNNRINNLVSNFGSLTFNSNYNIIKFLMFYQDKYLSSPLLSNNRKNYIILMYLKYQFSDIESINNIPRINSLIFHGNGTELFSERDYMYFNNVVPYMKFKNTLPSNYYVYSFSLNPLDDQFSGHQNYTNFDDSSITVSSNTNLTDLSNSNLTNLTDLSNSNLTNLTDLSNSNLTNFESYNLQLIVKQYNVLKIVSGIGNLLFN